ncbi:hypothetical protein [Bartonella krasnovii]|uniref:Transmembrane 9 family protein n=1 Tax=Bartonella krasnovii TaxID=2267275 RepID=A0A5B9D0K4_9HYPH|nr:hypothetical protein [Bartonella krasnovii]QEE12047.1 transmembrane 9 family protein [Bartonella krasnovii]UNF29934.1 hypothetical protein MNL13_04080 [Bartonella krasnovii]UNF36295.1 hypothetical protein MNL12_04080 [Bartonella krasnovii]UNF36406.1 hypothetical protein MNL11_04585 [Bartonella krasnovii]UNF39715.1 hypothetical protein MNL10_04740 [Bartonella krasnovii]
MIDKNYHTYEERMAEERKNHEQRVSIAKGIFAILLALVIIWFVFGFLGSFFARSPEHSSRYNTPQTSQSIPAPQKDLNSPPSVPYTYKSTQ